MANKTKNKTISKFVLKSLVDQTQSKLLLKNAIYDALCNVGRQCGQWVGSPSMAAMAGCSSLTMNTLLCF